MRKEYDVTDHSTLEAYLPDFSGLSSPAWQKLLHEPRQHAAESYEFLQMSDYRLDREDYLKIVTEAADYAKQCSELAQSFCDIFGIHLALKLGMPLGVRLDRYDAGFDRIVVTVPLGTVKRILDLCGERRHRPLDGIKLRDFDPLWDGTAHEPPESRSEAVTRCLQMLDGVAVGKLLRAFGNPGIEKRAIKEIAKSRAMLAFSNSVDTDKFRAAAARRRGEKYWFASARPVNL